jgi:hypothetical protein
VESLALKKDKCRRDWRLNLCSEESGGVEIYIPSKVVQAREYIEAKDTEEQAKRKAKEAQKVQWAANGLIQKQKQAKKEARQAIA